MFAVYAVAAVVAAMLSYRWYDPWYRSVSLPAWVPGDLLLRLGWPTGLMSTVPAFWLVSGSASTISGLAMGLLYGQLVTGLGWTRIFYRRRRARTAFYVICLHWTVAALAAAAAGAIDAWAGVLLLPWLAFTAYVGAFDFFTWQLEPRG